MAITSITIIQDNISDGSNLLAAQSPVSFIAEAAWTTAAPDSINVEILDPADTLIDTYKAIPYQDSAGVRSFVFQASLAIRSLLGTFDDFEQDADTWAFCEGLTGEYKIKFVDPDTPATYDEVLIVFAHAARQFGEGCNMNAQFDNDTDFYYANKDGVVYVYFYNSDQFIKEELTYTEADTFEVTAGYENLLLKGIGAGGSGAGITSEDKGGGGAGGQYAEVEDQFSIGNQLNITVPVATAGDSDNGVAGGDTIIELDGVGNVLVAKGGAGGTLAAGGVGATTSGVGDTVYKGGDGADPDGAYSGAGGGAAGELGNGASGVNPDGGLGNGVDSGDGGDGQEDSAESNGNPGTNYGGGGSGAVSLGNSVNGGDGAPGLAKIIVFGVETGFWRYKTTADQLKNITEPLIGSIKLKQVIPITSCAGDIILKYLDRNGHYRFFPFNRFYATRDIPEKIGSINRFLVDILSDQSDSKNIGYRNKRQIECTANVDATQLTKLTDIYTSPRVYMKIGSGDEAKDWLLVEIRASDNVVKRRKANAGAINLTLTLPEQYTITMI